jgi:hypothetical protein
VLGGLKATDAEAAAIVALYDGDSTFQGTSSAPLNQFSVTNAASYVMGALVPDLGSAGSNRKSSLKSIKDEPNAANGSI